MEFESADLSERHPTSPTFTDPSLLRAQIPSSRSLSFSSAISLSLSLSSLPLAHSLSLSLSLVHRESTGIGVRAEYARRERAQIEMLYYLNSVATTVRDLLVDVSPDSPL